MTYWDVLHVLFGSCIIGVGVFLLTHDKSMSLLFLTAALMTGLIGGWIYNDYCNMNEGFRRDRSKIIKTYIEKCSTRKEN